jgi:hypothetical protein
MKWLVDVAVQVDEEFERFSAIGCGETQIGRSLGVVGDSGDDASASATVGLVEYKSETTVSIGMSETEVEFV